MWLVDFAIPLSVRPLVERHPEVRPLDFSSRRYGSPIVKHYARAIYFTTSIFFVSTKFPARSL
jgi:hypothetical protein